MSQHLDVRASYAFIALSGPEIIREKLPWVREEKMRAGDGPRIISVVIDAGVLPFVYHSYQEENIRPYILISFFSKKINGS